MLGVLSLVLEDIECGTVGTLAQQPEFLIWTVSGWTAAFWIAMGAIGLLSAATFESARSCALAAGAIFGVVAVWGVPRRQRRGRAAGGRHDNNVMHAVLGGFGLLVAAMPRRAQIPSGPADQHSRTADREPRRFECDRRATPGRITGPR